MAVSPKVSGVLPVGHGSRFFGVAMNAFLSQAYDGELELVIVDNSVEPIKDLLPDDDRITYIRTKRMGVGALRNLGTEAATGDVIINIDEDDWSHPHRVATQVARLNTTQKAVTGFHSILYFDITDGRTYKYLFEPSGRNHAPYACGSSQCYLKSWWAKHKFPATGIEDHPFGQEAQAHGQLDSCPGEQLLVARAHYTSVCPANQLGRHVQFPAVAADELPAEFYSAIAEPAAPVEAKAKRKSKTTKVQES